MEAPTEPSTTDPIHTGVNTAADAATDADTATGTRADTYAELAAVGPYGVRPGHALITMVEPHPGHEYAYNRWYEDDHYIAGAMAMPWIYAGRRWVATRELQLLRYPAESAVARPVGTGCYLSTYWITEGRYDEHMRWTVAINKRLNRDSRVYRDRTHVFTSFQDHQTTVYRDGAAGPRDHHALDHPYRGLVLQVIDAAGPAERSELLEWLRVRHLPARIEDSPAAMVTVFCPTPLPADRMSYVKQVEGVDTRLTLLWFLQEDPRECWEAWFTGLDEAVAGAGRAGGAADGGGGAGSGLGRVELVAPFIPTIPGTDTYVDQLR